jgi:hypothetical protein
VKRILLLVLALVSNLLLLQSPVANAAQCLDNFPDSSWQSGEPKNLPLSSNLVRTLFAYEFSNEFGNSYSIKLETPTGSTAPFADDTPRDRIIDGLSLRYHLKQGARAKYTYTYKGANCQERTIVIDRVFTLTKLTVKFVNLNNNQEIIDNFFSPTSYANFIKSSNFLTKDYPTDAFKAFVQLIKSRYSIPIEASEKTGVARADEWLYEEFAKKNIDSRGFIAGGYPTVISEDGCIGGGNGKNTSIIYDFFGDGVVFPKNNPECVLTVYLTAKDNNLVKIGEYKALNKTLTYQKVIEKAAADKAAAELKIKQEAEAKAIADKAAADKAAADLKMKEEAQAAADKLLADAKIAAAKILAAAKAKAAATAKKTTITCIRGKLTKKVTAVNPKCPSGYKKK